jgi:hypothetical protein
MVRHMGYTPEWWQENREKVNAARNEKYKNDPEYRAKAQERARLYREKKRKEREAERENQTILIGGKERPALTTAQVCSMVDVTASRIKYMQRAGYLPPALVTRPVRLYTKRQANLIAKLEAFLRQHQDTLRGPTTPESAKVSKKLDALTTTIQTQWET